MQKIEIGYTSKISRYKQMFPSAFVSGSREFRCNFTFGVLRAWRLIAILIHKMINGKTLVSCVALWYVLAGKC